jgi:hypothetical protein
MSPNRAQNLYNLNEQDVKKISYWSDTHKENKQQQNVDRVWTQPAEYQQYFNKRAEEQVVNKNDKEPVVERIYPDRYNDLMQKRAGSPN